VVAIIVIIIIIVLLHQNVVSPISNSGRSRYYFCHPPCTSISNKKQNIVNILFIIIWQQQGQ
jgi:hypothetical protein